MDYQLTTRGLKLFPRKEFNVTYGVLGSVPPTKSAEKRCVCVNKLLQYHFHPKQQSTCHSLIWKSMESNLLLIYNHTATVLTYTYYYRIIFLSAHHGVWKL